MSSQQNKAWNLSHNSAKSYHLPIIMLKWLTMLCSFAAISSAAPTELHRLAQHRSIRPFSHPGSTHSTGLCITSAGLNGTTVSAAEYSSNWAGAVATDQNVTSVSGVFTVPRTRVPSESSRDVQYGAAAWVGIDGWTCGSGKSPPSSFTSSS